MKVTLAISVVVMLSAATMATGALSDNVFNGDFEDLGAMKNQSSYEVGSDPLYEIGPHRFDQTNDLGMWLGYWGPNSICGPGSCMGGFSVYDDPRDPALILPGELRATRDGADLGNMNVSIDPINGGGNHVLETVMFRPKAAHWVSAPAHQALSGPVQFSFDFFYEDWDPEAIEGKIHNSEVYIYGVNFLAPHDTSVYTDTDAAGSFMAPLGPGGWNAAALDGVLIARFRWGAWHTDDLRALQGNDNTGGWQTVSNQTPNVLWDDIDADSNATFLTAMTETYDYYVVSISSRVYGEGHPYRWMSPGNGDIIDTLSQGWDNFVLKVPVQQAGDFNLDSVTNLLDINDFVTAITNPSAYMSSYPTADVATIDPSQTGEAGDPTINLLDINYFVALVTGGGSSASLPEPATLGLLLIGGLALMRRRA